MAKRKKKAKVKSAPKKKPVKKATSKKVVSKKAAVKKVVTKKATKKVEEVKEPIVEVKVEKVLVKPARKLPTEVKKEWVALFSGSGSEIVDIVERLGYWPGMIITNNHLKTSWDDDIVKREEAITDKKKKTVRTVNVTQSKTANFIHRYAKYDDSKVTLHEWNKGIPDSIKTEYDVAEGTPKFIVPVVSPPEVDVVDPPTLKVETSQSVSVDPPKQSPISESPAKSKQWVAMFSQSGSEIADLSERMGFWPNVIVTNNSDKSKWDKRVTERSEQGEYTDRFKVVVVTSQQAETANFLHNVSPKNALITLHGWLRIIPKDICEQYKIVNGHPSLINQYPELKGKDPQERWWADRDKYDNWYGSVVHDVVAEVDAGQIHAVNKRQLTAYEELDCNPYELFRQTSLNSWLKYFIKFPIK
jgi:folate-dependent phosphoribosylglycinamide formyltransferase PurN